MKKILILGGTGFIGRVLVEQLKREPCSITLFNRGISGSGIFPEIRKITGDRETDDIKLVCTEDWDVIIDISSYYPNTLDSFLQGLKGKVQRYIFISTVSVYDFEKITQAPINENGLLLVCSSEEKTDKTLLSYGKRKAECERVILSKDWLDKIIFRPSLVYGKYDYTDRFYYWLYRFATQEKIIVPEESFTKSDYTFVEDFAKIIIKGITIKDKKDIYNTTTHGPKSLMEIIETIGKVSEKKPDLISASTEFLKSNKVSEWADLPLWLTSDLLIGNSALKNDFGIDFDSFEESVKKTFDFFNKLGWMEGKYGLSLKRESDLINLLKSPL